MLLPTRCSHHIHRFANEYGPLYKLRVGPFLWVLVTDPAEAAKVLKQSKSYLGTRPQALYRPLRMGVQPQLSNLLTLSDGPEHSAVRQATMGCFSPANLKLVGGGGQGRQGLRWLCQGVCVCVQVARRCRVRGVWDA